MVPIQSLIKKVLSENTQPQIERFITHVVNNLFPLYEYSEGEIKRLMDQFKEEADDLNISITDDQLKKYIIRFDQIKNHLS